MKCLGDLYRDGDGVDKCDATAAGWWQRAAERGHAAAALQYAIALEEGRGVPRDYPAALIFYRKAVKGEYSVAANFRLATLLLSGNVPTNDTEAFKLMKPLAQQEPSAAAWVGWMYANGRGVAADVANALKVSPRAHHPEPMQ